MRMVYLTKPSGLYFVQTKTSLICLRLKHTIILDDPFEDPKGLEALIPEKSPEPVNANVSNNNDT